MRRSMTLFLVLMLPIVWAAPVLAQTYGGPDFWGHAGWGWGHMIFGGLMMIAFWGGLILLIVLLVRWLAGPSSSSHVPPSATGRTPLQILQERFAKGEIDREEYEERKRVLSD